MVPVSQEMKPQLEQRQSRLSEIAKEASRLGTGLVEVTGEVQAVTIEIAGQLQTLFFLDESSTRLCTLADGLVQSSDQARSFLNETLSGYAKSEKQVAESTRDIHALVDLVHGLSVELDDFEKSLGKVGEVTGEICRVARSARMLALNATIESARAGEAGKGFAVVANEVKILSVQAAQVTSNVQSTIEELRQETHSLLSESESAGATATLVSQATDKINSSIVGVDALVAGLKGQTLPIQAASTSIQEACRSLGSCLHEVSHRISGCSEELKASLEEVQEVGEASQALVGVTACLGVPTWDTPFVARAQTLAGQLSTFLNHSLSAERLTREDLFDGVYQPIAKTSPQRFHSRFSESTHDAIRALLGQVLEADSQTLHAMVIDRNGYIPTWLGQDNSPQADPSGLMAKDRVALAASRNLEPFLLQLYRRNEAGNRVVIKEVSAPIEVDGEHWGAVRLGYRAEPDDLLD